MLNKFKYYWAKFFKKIKGKAIYNSTILPTSKVEAGSVVGMGSVVTKDVLPYTIVAGNPAKEIRKRFDEDTISRLLEVEWWSLENKELEKVARNINLPERFLKEF